MGDRYLIPAHYYREVRIIGIQSAAFSVAVVGSIWAGIVLIKKRFR